jgi:hypothetical protein
MTTRPQRSKSEHGIASIWTLLITAGAFTLLLGLVVDGGNAIDARQQAAQVAQQAARAGADALSAAAIRSGSPDVDPAVARTRAEQYLRTAGQKGTVAVSGRGVTVTVIGRVGTKILGIIGIGSFPIAESATARGVAGG